MQVHREHVDSVETLNQIESEVHKETQKIHPHFQFEPELKPLGQPTTDDLKFYQGALNEARKGCAEGGIPIGAVLVYKGEVIGRGYNKRIQFGSAIRHGEMDCFENCGRQNAEVYRECTMYTTLSPCSMCAGAIGLFGIPRVVIGENVNFKGDEELMRSRGTEVVLLNDQETIEIMRRYIDKNRSIWCEDIGVTHL